MSLLNQVLRDLDRRQAATVTPSTAAASPLLGTAAVGPRQRMARWGLGIAITAAAIVAGGWAQGSIAWPARSAHDAGPVATPATHPMDTPVVKAAPAPAPVATVAVAPLAVATQPATTLPAAALPAAVPPTPPAVQVALAPMAAPRPAARPPRRIAPPPAVPAPEAPAAGAAARNEPRIDKRAPSRTTQERAEAQYQHGVAEHQAGRIDASATAFMAALHEEPRFAPARLAQAGLLIGQSRTDEALALLQEGVALAPTQPQLALMLARLQAERHDLTAAIDTLAAASGNAAHDAEYQGLQAAILQRAGRHAEAVEKFSAALRLAPGQSVWWMGLGISLAATGQAEVAREAFSRAKATGGLPAEAGLYVDARLRQMM